MRYVKPIIIELSTRARSVAGTVPRACVGGDTAADPEESCGIGNGAGWACGAGTGGGGAGSCMPGGTANTDGDCISGTFVAYYCGAGTGGIADPMGCRVGPGVGCASGALV
jgi:hypothetical protein